tara:strand:- start:1096 stop:1407 length:312 start_codon:yes stop_codon:yes gene_type:complete
MNWLRQNAGTVAGWIGMAAMLFVGAITQWTAAKANQEQALAEIVQLEAASIRHDAELSQIKSDVRSVREQQERLDAVVTRQEGAVRELEKLTIEIRAIVRAKD